MRPYGQSEDKSLYQAGLCGVFHDPLWALSPLLKASCLHIIHAMNEKHAHPGPDLPRSLAMGLRRARNR